MDNAAGEQAHEHRIGLERETGFGFGQLDYYCWDCGKRVKSVSLADMDDAEKTHVGRLTGRVFGMGVGQ